MKIATLVLPLALLVGCSSPDTDSPETATAPAPAGAPHASAPVPATPVQPVPNAAASASGVVESVDVAEKTVTIAHGAVDALEWPAMTMTFKAPDVDLSTVKHGDQISFEFTAVGMDGTITSITRD